MRCESQKLVLLLLLIALITFCVERVKAIVLQEKTAFYLNQILRIYVIQTTYTKLNLVQINKSMLFLYKIFFCIPLVRNQKMTNTIKVGISSCVLERKCSFRLRT